MKTSYIPALAAGVAVLCASAVAFAQTSARDFGKREYDSNCASCHGVTGKGDGPLSRGYLTKAPSDLTTLAKRNNGVFPHQRVAEMIDGRQEVAAHGPRDMPVWGRDYRLQAGEYYVDVPYDPEAYARARILALTDYLARLQAK
jgi:mono/diheme cytochrome c family protein